MLLEIDEGQRQMVLLALGRLAAKRPGWDYALNEVAKKIDNVNDDGRAKMFEEFRKHGRQERPPTAWTRLRYEDPVYVPPGGSINMSQSHSKFLAYVVDGPLSQSTLDGIAAEVNGANVSPKSVGVEYLEGSKRTVLSVGHSDGHHYSISLRQENLGKIEVTPAGISQALEGAASKHENVICHEFYATDDGTFYAVLMLQG